MADPRSPSCESNESPPDRGSQEEHSEVVGPVEENREGEKWDWARVRDGREGGGRTLDFLSSIFPSVSLDARALLDFLTGSTSLTLEESVGILDGNEIVDQYLSLRTFH